MAVRDLDGNPHMRFEAGEAAPVATSRRGALFRKAKATVLAFVVGVSAMTEARDAKVWIGGASGDWNDSANWDVISTTASTVDFIFTNEVTFADGDTGAYDSGYIYLTNSTATLHFRGGGLHKARQMHIANGGSLHIWDAGCFTLDPSNGELHCDATSSIFCHAENAFPPQMYNFELNGTLNLGGYDQAITRLGKWTGNFGLVVKSPRPAMLKFMAPLDIDVNIKGSFTDYAGLFWNPASSGKTVKLYYASDTMGEMVVSNGVMDLNNSAYSAHFTKLAKLDIGDSGTLRIHSSQSLGDFFVEHLVVHDGGSVLFGDAGNTSTVSLPRVSVVATDGTTTELAPGTYGAADGDGVTGLSWLSGSGAFFKVQRGMSYWKLAQSGTWGTAANWSDGVPSAATGAGIVESGGDYSVTVDAPAVATNLAVRNFGDGTATLNVASSLVSTKGVWQIGFGGKVAVPEGGRIEYRGFDDETTSKFANANDIIGIVGDAILEVRGEVVVTNMCGALVVGGEDQSTTSKIVIAGNGEMLYHFASDADSYFKLYPGGCIEAKDNGVFRMAKTTEWYAWTQKGGSLDFSGHSTFDLNGMWDVCLGQGRAVFSDDAKMVGNGSVGNGNARLYFAADAGTPTEVYFNDRAVYSAGSNAAITELRPKNGGRIAMHFDSDATHTLGYLVLGRTSYKGYADIYISDGVVNVDSTTGFNQGWSSRYCNADSFTTGCVHQTGGAFVVNGGDGTKYSDFRAGFILGDGLTSTTVREPTALGVYELSGGVVTNASGTSPFVLGIGRGRGEFVQTGGSFVSKATHANAPAIFGFSNGYGYYTLSNGTANVSSKIWVGGISPTTCSHTNATYVGTEAVGRITVAAADLSKPCRFAAADAVVLGGLGEGALEMGPGGTFAGTDLVLSNNTASVLKFRVTNDGAGTVDLSGKLTITDGASLVVDATEFTNTRANRLTLARFASKEGDFAPGKVTLLSNSATPLTLSMKPTGIQLAWFSGTIITVH